MMCPGHFLVEKCFRGMCSSAPRIDVFPTDILKNHIGSLIQPLSNIINLSLSAGVYTDKFKTDQVVPIYKSSNKLDMNNYHPIPILSTFAEVLEKCVKTQLQFYLENIDCNQQAIWFKTKIKCF